MLSKQAHFYKQNSLIEHEKQFSGQRKNEITNKMLALWIQIGFVIFHIFNGSSEAVSRERTLIRKLQAGHSTEIRPQPASLDGPTVVNVSIRLTQILDIDEKNEILSILAWVSMEWDDTHFTWDPGSNDNVQKLSFPASNIWVPDILLYNTDDIGLGYHLGLPESDEDQHFYAVATPNGSIELGFPQVFKSSCKLNIGEYPFDKQSCMLQFGSWSYNSKELLINVNGGEIVKEQGYFITNKAWQKVGSNCKSSIVRCAFQDDAQCSVATCYLDIKRTAWFEVVSYTLPTVIIAILSLMVFMVPPEAGKRMEVGITLILCVAVYLSLINKKMPTISDSFPLVSKFYGCVIVEITIAMICSCYCLHIYDPEGLRLLHFPNYLRTMAFGFISRIIFYKTDGGKPNRVHPTKDIQGPKIKEKHSLAKTNNNKIFVRSAQTFDSQKPAKNEALKKMEDIKECELRKIPNGVGRNGLANDIKGVEEISNNDQNVLVISNNDQNEELRVEELAEGETQQIPNENIEQEAETSEVRCDSGFGELDGRVALSNRSSLVSSKSVALPSGISSPQPAVETEDEQAAQDNSIDTSHDTKKDSELELKKTENEKDEQLEKSSAIPLSDRTAMVLRETRLITRSMTTVFKSRRGLVPTSLTARPYTDSALQKWSSHNKHSNIKAPGLLHKEFMQAKKAREDSSKPAALQIRSESVLETEAPLTGVDNENGTKDGEPKTVQKNPIQQENKKNKIQNDSKMVQTAKARSQTVTSESSKQDVAKDNEIVLRKQVAEKAGSKTKPVTKRKISNTKPAVERKTSKSSIVHEHVEMHEARKDSTKNASTNNMIADNSNADEETIEKNCKNVTIVPTQKEIKKGELKKSIDVKRKLSARNSEIKIDLVEKKENDEDKTLSFDEKQTEREERSEASEGSKNISDSTHQNETETKNLFARRKWTILRQNVQEKYTVKDIFGQILTPDEKNPIVAIANVLLRDQRRFTMRTEWMTSAMIFNRFFIILLALAVFISLLAVFLQSSRLRNVLS